MALEDAMMRGWKDEIRRKERLGQRDLPCDFTLDLHGMRAELAVAELDRRLNSEFMKRSITGLIICGHGTGKLLLVIGQELAKHPLVSLHRLAEDGRGAYRIELEERDAE